MKVQLVCLLLTMFTMAVLSLDPKTKRMYKKFKRQHINEQMTPNRCDAVMRAKHISRVGRNGCKKINTFIRAPINEVKPVCGNAGVPYGEMTLSQQRFQIVVCTLKNKRAKYPKCHYRGEDLAGRIVIKCEDGFPVHYARYIGQYEN